MYAQTPQDMTRALFEAQLVELQRARAIRKKYHTDVVLGLTSAIRVLLIDMPSPYDKIKLLDYLHIVVEEPRFRSSHEGVKFHAYTATLPPDRTHPTEHYSAIALLGKRQPLQKRHIHKRHVRIKK